MSILDDVGAFWNPSTPIDHVALYWQKMDPLANLEVTKRWYGDNPIMCRSKANEDS